jgi:hypothetical protein
VARSTMVVKLWLAALATLVRLVDEPNAPSMFSG